MMIKLDITVGAMNLVDQFEWDANESDPVAAEKFAEAFATDLGLSGEFKTAIAHSIREQVSVHVKSLAMTGHTFDGRPIADEELRGAFLGPVNKSNLSRGRSTRTTSRLACFSSRKPRSSAWTANASARPSKASTDARTSRYQSARP